ncbi:flagellin [Alphaproteobacteria bacterium]|nr:flagellin [Alphaproteobacteria bacterium]
MAAVTTLYHLSNKDGSMNKALERISSGLRLNHAVDDAAGASIVNRMTSQIKGIEAAIRNAADAISLTQTAEGSLEEVAQILHRMRELSVQAANGVYTGQDRQAINNEVVAMQNELGRIAESSRFNGVRMLNGEFQDTTFQIGFTANDTATLSIEDVRPQGLGEYVLSSSNNNVADVVIGAAVSTRTGTTAGTAGTQQIEKITAPTAPTIAAGDKFKVTVNGTTVETAAAAGTEVGLSGIVGMLNAANTAGSTPIVPGAFAVSGSDITFTYTNAGPVSGTVSKLFFYDASAGSPAYDAGTGTGAQATGGVAVASSSVISSPEGDITITVDKMSGNSTTANTINKITTDVTGGTFTLSGTDAALFDINATTGAVTSKVGAGLDYETVSNRSNTIIVTYAKDGVTLVNETITLNVTNRAADDNNTQVPAFAQPKLGTSLANVASGIIEAEDFTIYGNVGTKTIDVNGGSSARDIVTSVNSLQGETGVYAEAQTRVNLTFPDQATALSDSITFSLTGKNKIPQVISGTVDFGVTNGRDANVRALADAVNNASGATGISAKVSPNGATLTLVSNEGYDVVLSGYELTSLAIDATVYPADENFNSIGTSGTLKEGAANNNSMRVGGVLTFHSPYVFSIDTAADGSKGGGLFQQTPGAAKLSAVSDLNVLTVEGAKKMLTAVDGALVRIDLERSDIGATMSRMEHTIKNLSNIALNTKASRSRIQDADIAAETVELNRAQVLTQAAQAMLAQANRTSQSILSLLQS